MFTYISRFVKTTVVSSLGIFSLCVFSSAGAETLKGEITFLKKPPYAGILYVLDEEKKVSAVASVDQKDREFTKRIVPTSKGLVVTFNNSDSVDHNIFAQDKATGAKFDIGLMPPGNTSTVDVNWEENSLIRIGCKIHPKMRSYIANVPSNHYQVFQFRDDAPPYTFSIEGISKASTKAILILPGYDFLEIDLNGDSGKSLTFTRKGKPKGNINIRYEG